MLKNLLYVGGFQSGQRGAVGTHTSGIIRGLEKSKEINLIGAFYSFAKPFYCPKKSFFFEADAPKGVVSKILLMLRFVFFIRSFLKRGDIDTVYVRFDPFFCFIMSFLWKKKYVVEYNDVFLDQVDFACKKGAWSKWGRYIRSSVLYKKFILFAERRVFERAALVVVVTEGLFDYCVNVCVSAKLVILNNATDVTYERVDVVSPNLLIISHVGTLTYWDGLEDFLSALALAKNKDKNFSCHFNIIGDGALKETLLKTIKNLGLQENVSMRSAVTHAEAQQFLSTTDVVPLLKTISGYGLSPIKFYEAMGKGCHLLVSDIPHINEIPSFVGSVVQFPLNIEEIADAILECWRNIETIRSQRLAVANYAQREHSWDRRIEQLLLHL